MNNTSLRKRKNEGFIMLTCEFLENFVEKEIARCYESQGIETGKINEQIAFCLRD